MNGERRKIAKPLTMFSALLFLLLLSTSLPSLPSFCIVLHLFRVFFFSSIMIVLFSFPFRAPHQSEIIFPLPSGIDTHRLARATVDGAVTSLLVPAIASSFPSVCF
uniref:Putative secreted peptide n=1 Tax=Anopheles braziliensis TaxID=58242 RepID=A0A2M3ZWJ5_9DIPT